MKRYKHHTVDINEVFIQIIQQWPEHKDTDHPKWFFIYVEVSLFQSKAERVFVSE